MLFHFFGNNDNPILIYKLSFCQMRFRPSCGLPLKNRGLTAFFSRRGPNCGPRVAKRALRDTGVRRGVFFNDRFLIENQRQAPAAPAPRLYAGAPSPPAEPSLRKVERQVCAAQAKICRKGPGRRGQISSARRRLCVMQIDMNKKSFFIIHTSQNINSIKKRKSPLNARILNCLAPPYKRRQAFAKIKLFEGLIEWILVS